MQNTAKNAVADALKTKSSEENDKEDQMWCRIKRPKKEKGLSSYFRAIPPEDVEAVRVHNLCLQLRGAPQVLEKQRQG